MNKNVLSALEPKKVFKYFEEISAIPRGSGKTDAVSAYCEKFAAERNLKCVRDGANNVIIFKDATPGYENSDPVILQGHLDMVWEKSADSPINFETDGLSLCVDGDFVKAEGTTLGADDGIAVAMFLAILDSDDISHPPLEILLTTDEETGMNGAFALDVAPLKGKKMINVDSEQEGTLWVSCAGGARVDIELPVSFAEVKGTACEIVISGLHGGHSGAEIHVGYANANILMGRVLEEMLKSLDFSIVEVNGGTMDNAITRESRCKIILNSEVEALYKIALKMQTRFLKEYGYVDPDISVKVVEAENCEKAFEKKSTEAFVALINRLPNGVVRMSEEIDGLVETSLNLGVVKMKENAVSLTFSVRSSKDSERKALIEKLISVAASNNSFSNAHSEYPAWEYKKDSVLREKMASIYKDMFGKPMTVTAIHAGLECGLFCGKISGLDCVSLGPDMFDIHSPSERLSISSTERVWNYLLEVLKQL